MNQASLADELDVSQPTVSRWLNGAKPELAQHDRIVAQAKRLGVWEEPSLPVGFESEAQPFATNTVRVVGYVGAGAATHFYAISQGDLDEVPAPEGSTADTVAVEIRGDSLGSLFDRWLVFYDQVRSPVTSDLIGRLCVVGLPDDRVLVKKIQNGSRKGFHRLLSEREPPIEDVLIAWAARVKSMVPR